MLTADQIAARRKPADLNYRRTNRLAVDWVKLHEPDVWEQIRGYVDRRHA